MGMVGGKKGSEGRRKSWGEVIFGSKQPVSVEEFKQIKRG